MRRRGRDATTGQFHLPTVDSTVDSEDEAAEVGEDRAEPTKSASEGFPKCVFKIKKIVSEVKTINKKKNKQKL